MLGPPLLESAGCMPGRTAGQPRTLHALLGSVTEPGLRCLPQWEAIESAGGTSEAKEAVFRRHWSLKEVGATSGTCGWKRVPHNPVRYLIGAPSTVTAAPAC